MRFQVHLFLIAFVCLLCSSCGDKSVPMGTVEYYPKFLFVPAKIVPVTNDFEFEFSQDAVNEKKEIFAEFDFVDNQGKPLSAKELTIELNGNVLHDNTFRLSAQAGAVQNLKLSFSFPPGTKKGKHQGYLRLKKHNLHRVDNQMLGPGEQVQVFQWTLWYNPVWNPLKRVLALIVALIVAFHLLWFILLRPLIYPRFGNFSKTMLIKQEGRIVAQYTLQYKGARKMVFTDKPVKQSLLSQIYQGKIKTLINPLFTDALTFVPQRKNAVAFGSGYTVKSNPIPKGGRSTIIYTPKKLEISLF